jgi:putative membrane protein
MATSTRWLTLWLGVGVIAVLIAAIAGGAMMGPGMMWGYGSSGTVGGWGMALGTLAMLAFWIALIAGVVLLVRWTVSQASAPNTSTGTDDSVAFLKRRYAAGEMDQATYERMKGELTA